MRLSQQGLRVIATVGTLAVLFCGRNSAAETRPPQLLAVATSARQWTGVTVSKENRVFVNYPRWGQPVPFAVGELLASGEVVPFPDSAINHWEKGRPAGDKLVCVQSVVVGPDNHLWILDPANPEFKGVVPRGPKLLKVDLATSRVVQKIMFDATIAPKDSYLNDVRVDAERGYAYMTDSGTGALVVTNLKTGKSLRRLHGHPSVMAEPTTLTIGGKPWVRDGVPPKVHSDGIALDPAGEYLYYQALTGRTLYRIPTAALRDPRMTDSDLAGKVENLGRTGPADGIEAGADGYIYLTALEENAIKRFRPGGKVETVVRSPELSWPDTLSFGPDGWLYVTTSRIHESPKPLGPYGIFKLKP